MKCEEIEALMSDYLDNRLDESQKKEIELHLETCEKCLDDMKESQEVLNLISENEKVLPDESLRINFYHMLHNEIKRTGSFQKESLTGYTIPWYANKPFLYAAGIAILVCGAFIGMLINSGRQNKLNMAEMDQMQAKVAEMKKNAMLTMLNEESSSFRLQGIGYADDIEKPDDTVIEALLKTLNQDKNVNVRMAAAFSLSKFTGDRMVCDSLVASLPRQNDPILQVTLINILVGIKEKSALKTIQQIINNKQTLQEVRAVAENGEKELIL